MSQGECKTCRRCHLDETVVLPHLTHSTALAWVKQQWFPAFLVGRFHGAMPIQLIISLSSEMSVSMIVEATPGTLWRPFYSLVASLFFSPDFPCSFSRVSGLFNVFPRLRWLRAFATQVRERRGSALGGTLATLQPLRLDSVPSESIDVGSVRRVLCWSVRRR